MSNPQNLVAKNRYQQSVDFIICEYRCGREPSIADIERSFGIDRRLAKRAVEEADKAVFSSGE